MRTPHLILFCLPFCLPLVGCKAKALPTSPAAPAMAPELAKIRLIDNFKRVTFETDSADLSAESRSVIADNVEILKDHPLVEIVVVGHADDRGARSHNVALGEARAEAVRAEMIAQGVSGDRVHVATHGEHHDLIADDSARAWSANRRAEFIVISDPRDMVDGSLDNGMMELDHELRVE